MLDQFELSDFEKMLCIETAHVGKGSLKQESDSQPCLTYCQICSMEFNSVE